MINDVLRATRFDPAPRHRVPSVARLVLATVASVALCLGVDWLIARIAVAVFSSTKGYSHFQFGDYSTLTVIGVVAACVGWPVVVRLCSAPRWLFGRLAVLVTAVLLLPDLYIFLQGQPGRAVAFLALMHLAIGLITYTVLVHVAPARDQMVRGFSQTAQGRETSRTAP